MKFESEASKEFYLSLTSVDTLVHFAKKEDKKNNSENRTLFLKLSIVLMVTRFQVYIESILNEFKNKMIDMNLSLDKVPEFMKLNSLRLITSKIILSKKLNNLDAYDSQKYDQIHKHIKILKRHFGKGKNKWRKYI
jgi:type III secretory pathway component EscR